MTMIQRSRRVSALAAATAVALVLAGCSSDEATSEEPDSDAAVSDAYPVTVETVYGEITLEEKPERIVAIGSAYVDLLLAIDEQPIAFVGDVRAGEDFIAGHPWFEDANLDTSGHDLSLFSEGYTPSLEAIAAYEPDLILGTAADWAIDETMYEQISLIAPTYTPHDPQDWQLKLNDLGVLTGKTEEAAQVLTDVESEFADARDRLPGLQGATFVIADVVEQEVVLRTNRFFFEELGLQPDAELAAIERVSVERLDEITSDVVEVMAWRAPDVQESLESDPRFAELQAVQNGTLIWSDATMTTAADAGPASMSWWLEQVVPQLENSELNSEGQ